MPEDHDILIPSNLQVIPPPSALESLERASIDMQISTARRFPRTLSVVLARVTEMATLDIETAASCFYRLGRKGKAIEGPTIRFAEIVVSAYGNIRYGARVVANDGKHVTAQGFCHDLENNVMNSQEVKRRITTTEGVTYNDDMQTVTGNAACAIAARNSVFKVIPFALVKSILAAAKQVAIGDIKTLAERRTRTLDWLSKIGVNEKRACAAVGKSGAEDIGLEELAILFGLYNAVKEEEQTVEEAFPEPRVGIKLGNAIPDEAKPDKKKRKEKQAKAETKQEPPATKQEPPAQATPLEGLVNRMSTSEILSPQLLVFLFSKQMCEQGDRLETLKPEVVADCIENWEAIAKAIKEE